MSKSVVFAVMIGVSAISMSSVFGMNSQGPSSEQFNDQKYPLHAACRKGQYEVVEHLLEQGFDFKEEDNHGKTALFYALRSESYPIVSLLAKMQGQPVVDRCYYSLHQACKEGDVEKISELLEYGADIDVKDSLGNKPLDYAKESGCEYAVHDILNSHEIARNQSAQKCQRLYPQFMAFYDGDFEKFKKLYRWTRYEFPDFYDSLSPLNLDEATPLHRACYVGSSADVALLIEDGAMLDELDFFGQTPLQVACYRNHSKVAELLISAGASVFAIGKAKAELKHVKCNSPLHYTFNHQNFKLARLLLSRGANPNIDPETKDFFFMATIYNNEVYPLREKK